jgi:WD40 repeat protein
MVYALAVGNRSVLVGERAGAVRALDARNPRTQLAIWKLSETGPIRSIAMSADERWAVAGTQNGLIHLLFLTQPAPVQTVSDQMGSVDTVTANLEGLVATGTREGSVKLWRCSGSSLEELLTLSFPGPIRRVLFSPAGDHLGVLVDGAYAIRILDLKALQALLRPLRLDWQALPSSLARWLLANLATAHEHSVRTIPPAIHRIAS